MKADAPGAKHAMEFIEFFGKLQSGDAGQIGTITSQAMQSCVLFAIYEQLDAIRVEMQTENRFYRRRR